MEDGQAALLRRELVAIEPEVLQALAHAPAAERSVHVNVEPCRGRGCWQLSVSHKAADRFDQLCHERLKISRNQWHLSFPLAILVPTP